MQHMTPLHWLVVLVTAGTLFIPTGIILKRAGYSPFLIFLLLLPGMPVLGLWIFAFAKWPALSRKDEASTRDLAQSAESSTS